MADSPEKEQRVQPDQTIPVGANPTSPDPEPADRRYPPWLFPIAAVIIVGLLTWVGFLAREFLNEKFDNLTEEIAETNQKIGNVDERLKKLNGRFKNFKQDSEGEHERLYKSIQAVKKTLPQEVQEQIDLILSKYSAMVEEQQRQLKDELVRVGAEYEAAQHRIGELETELDNLSATLWQLGESAFRAKVEEAIRESMKRIIIEWQEAADRQSQGAPIPAGLGFIPAGATLSTKPEVRVQVKGRAISLEGVVPSDAATTALIRAAQGVRPKPTKVDTDKLKVQP